MGPEAPGLSPATISRLKQSWQDELTQWQKRSLMGKRYVYVWVDGVYAGSVSLHASTTSYRKVVWSRSWATAGAHTVTLVVVGTSGHPRVDVDALVVAR